MQEVCTVRGERGLYMVKMIVYTALILMFLVFVHELGHFFAAKTSGVKVNKFAIGMGPVLFKRQKGETEYSLRILPIGGFCSIEGEDEDSNDVRSFSNKSLAVKAKILVAGSFMNLLTALIIMIAIFMYTGMPTTSISGVTAGGMAEIAGIKAGDRIVAVDGKPVKEWKDFSVLLSEAADESVRIKVVRDGEEKVFVTDVAEKDGRKIIGVTSKIERNPARAVVYGVKSITKMGHFMYDVLGQLVSGKVSAKELSGPVGIAYVVGDSASLGLQYVFYITALISLNLAIINMLPLPALDGGRLLFAIIRAVSRGRFSENVEMKINLIGMALLFALMIYVTWNDIGRFILNRG